MMDRVNSLSEYKEKVIDIGNKANNENIGLLLKLIREMQKYISINYVGSGSNDSVYHNLEIIFNYLSDLPLDNNDTALIAIKSHIVSQLDLLSSSKTDLYKYDVFISHASKDKLAYVNSLKDEIKKLGISIFYDSDVFKWGDNWKKSILDATSVSEFAIIIISNNFFDREWTEKELDEFIRRQNDTGQKIVLPLIYNVSPDDVIKKYPFLEDIQYINTKDYTKKEITYKLAELLIERYKNKK